MKRILSVVAILALAALLVLPVVAQAAFRGSFASISQGDALIRGKFAPVLRGGITGGSGTQLSPRRERWLAFVTPSTVFGSESVGEIWIYRNVDVAVPNNGLDPVPMLRDETGVVSYIDPAWSKDGKWLAYVQTDNNVTQSSIYVQQYNTVTSSGTAPTFGNAALGGPILVADGSGGIHHRHPAFTNVVTNSTTGIYAGQIAYDSDAFGPSIDLWTVEVTLDANAHTGIVNEASRTRHQLGLEGSVAGEQLLNSKAEFKPDYSPDNTRLAFVSNRLGVFQIYLLTLTASGLGESTIGVEPTPALVTKDNPSWSSDGSEVYYDAPSNEDPANPQDIWKIDLATGQKCNMFVDLAGDVDADVSQYTNVTGDGATYNEFVFISQAAGLGVQIWRGQKTYDCTPPLFAQVSITPSLVDLNAPPAAADTFYTLRVSYPQSVRDQRYVCRPPNNGGEGIRMRNSIIASPTIMGLRLPGYPVNAAFDCTAIVNEIEYGTQGGSAADPYWGLPSVNCEQAFSDPYLGLGSTVYGFWDMVYDTTGGTSDGPGKNHAMLDKIARRVINNRIVALNLVNKYVPITYRHYTNVSGRQFLGFAYLQLVRSNYGGAGSIVMRQNYPNPFNPMTKIQWAQDKPGRVNVRVFNVRGELVKTIADTWYPKGEHTVAWNGETQNGGRASSGVYYVRTSALGSNDVIKAVMAR
jgi:hypothetical protein